MLIPLESLVGQKKGTELAEATVKDRAPQRDLKASPANNS